MSNLKLIVAAAAALFVAAPAFADRDEDDDNGTHHKKHFDESSDRSDHEDGDRDEDHDRGEGHDRSRHRGEERRFRSEDRDQIVRYYHEHEDEGDHDDEDREHQIPQGWRKQIARGQRIPDDIWAHRVPVPPEVVVKLPTPLPPGVVLIRIHNQVVRAVEQTHEVLDVLGLPHPPAPPRIERR